MLDPKRKLGLKDRYAAMTRGLGWDTTYQSMEDVFPYDTYEGIKIHDWEAFEDPFRLTMDAYWKYQSEKEKKLYAVIDSFCSEQRSKRHYGCTLHKCAQALPDGCISARICRPSWLRL